MKLLAVACGLFVLGATAAVAVNPFTDVPAGHFAEDPIDWAYNQRITVGTSETTFSPEREVTRAESVTFTYRYDANVVQPALSQLEDTIAAHTARLDQLEAAETVGVVDEPDPTPGPMVITHGGPVGNDFGTRLRRGASRIPLAGPMSVDGTAYALASVRYCISDVSGDRPVDAVSVHGVDADGPQELAFDDTDRTADGCHDLEVGSTMGSFVFTIEVGQGCYLDLYGVTSTWEPIAAKAVSRT